MAKDEQSNQLNLTVVALVALVAIVGLVALVMNAASIKSVPRIATGSQVVSASEMSVADAKAILAEEAGETNLAGNAYHSCSRLKLIMTADGDREVAREAATRLFAWQGCKA